MKHPCEPSLVELEAIRKQLYTAKSTYDNVRKLKAIEAQINRHKKEDESAKER